MSLYELPKIKFLEGPKIPSLDPKKSKIFWMVLGIIFVSVVFGFLSGVLSSALFYFKIGDLKGDNTGLPTVNLEEKKTNEYFPQTSEEEMVIKLVEENSPAVVSIIISKDVPIFEEYYKVDPFFGFPTPQYRQKGFQKEEIGGGTGFIVSSDGLILTNKHVVSEEGAEYTVFTNDGKKFPAKILAKDPFQDLAIIKIDQDNEINKEGGLIKNSFPTVKLGDSDTLKNGQTVIAIGNALGEFRNTISKGVVSGLGRKITASGGDFVETLEDVIQTDAAINKGNSGGPLLNLKGEVIGVNTATAIGAQSIGFAIPINKAKKALKQVKEMGKIVYPFLGIRYILVDDEIKDKYNLTVDYGALIVKGEKGESAIWPDSAAYKAGLKEGDIILEFNNEKITTDNSLVKIISKYNPGDNVKLKVLRREKEFEVDVVLGEKTD